MTGLLLRLFVKDHGEPKKPAVRTAVGRLSGMVGILCNLVLFGGKLAAGILSGSVAITADAMNNLSDSVSSVVTLVGFHLAERPADRRHPYGHARFEYLSGLAVAAMILIIGVQLGEGSVRKILAPEPVQFSPVAVGILAASILVKLWLAVFNRKLGRYIDSSALLAAAADSRNDVLSTGAVLAAVLVQRFFHWQIDGYMGLAVAIFIFCSGISLGRDTISPLLGEGASPELKRVIRDIVRDDDWVLGYHDLMVHDYGPGQRFASIHVEMDSRRSVLQCHERIDAMERRCLREQNVHLVIHYDPVLVGDPLTDRLHSRVSALAETMGIRIHDFRVVPGEDHVNVIFDAVVPPDCDREAVQQAVEQALSDGKTCYHGVITFDSQNFN